MAKKSENHKKGKQASAKLQTSESKAVSENRNNSTGILISSVVFMVSLLALWVLTGKMFDLTEGVSIENELFFRYRNYRALGVVLLLLSGVGIFFFGVIKTNIHERLKNISLPFISLFCLLLAAEIPFSYYAESDGVGTTWAHVLWSRKFWVPKPIDLPDGKRINLRDDGSKLNWKKKIVYSIGDSFTNGDGLDSPSFSFPSLIRQKINAAHPEEFCLVNLGEQGADTYRESNNYYSFQEAVKNELGQLPATVAKPRLVIWQYYGNDVDFTASKMGVSLNIQENIAERLFAFLFKARSFSTDYFYWHFLKKNNETEYLSFLEQCYSGNLLKIQNTTGSVKLLHFEPVKSFISECNRDSIPLLFVIFPLMNNIPLSQKLYAIEMEKLLESNNIPVINMSPLFAPFKPEDIIVNKRNPHPNAAAHQIAADTIFKYLTAHNMLE